MIMPMLAIIGTKSGSVPHLKDLAGFQLQLIFSLFAGEETDSSGVFLCLPLPCSKEKGRINLPFFYLNMLKPAVYGLPL